jgi:hypothetical protein
MLGGGGRGFESRIEYGSSYVLFVACCVGSGLCDRLISRPEGSYGLCDPETSAQTAVRQSRHNSSDM